MTTPEYDAHKDHNVSYLPFVAETARMPGRAS
jgi:hypothetical protein